MRMLRDNSLTMVLLAAFLISVIGMALTGWSAHNEELQQHGHAAIGLVAYLASGNFISAMFENWESEFLQMAFYVGLTAFLFQRGSAESKDPDDPKDEESFSLVTRGLPLSQRLNYFLYSYSLGIMLTLLFVLSFIFHLVGSAKAANEEALLHGMPIQTLSDYAVDPQFWFESFQNWQSEFLSTAVLVVLSIFLRFRGSPESKPVTASNAETGH